MYRYIQYQTYDTPSLVPVGTLPYNPRIVIVRYRLELYTTVGLPDYCTGTRRNSCEMNLASSSHQSIFCRTHSSKYILYPSSGLVRFDTPHPVQNTQPSLIWVGIQNAHPPDIVSNS